MPRELYITGAVKGNGNELIFKNLGTKTMISGNYGMRLASSETYKYYTGASGIDTVGIITDPTKSGLIVDRNNSKYLNFYIN